MRSGKPPRRRRSSTGSLDTPSFRGADTRAKALRYWRPRSTRGRLRPPAHPWEGGRGQEAEARACRRAAGQTRHRLSTETTHWNPKDLRFASLCSPSGRPTCCASAAGGDGALLAPARTVTAPIRRLQVLVERLSNRPPPCDENTRCRCYNRSHQRWQPEHKGNVLHILRMWSRRVQHHRHHD
jgi:hypothetical protein